MAITEVEFENKKLRISALSSLSKGEKEFSVVEDFMKRIDGNDEFNKDFKDIKFEDLENPFWDISGVESTALEKKMLQFSLFSQGDHQNANTPLREKKRLADFQAQIDELFN